MSKLFQFDGKKWIEIAKNGKDGSPDTPKQIVEKVESLTGDDRLDIEKLKGLDKIESNFLDQAKGFAPRAFASLYDVNLKNPTNGQVPKYNATTQKWENGSDLSGTGDVVGPSSATSDDIAVFDGATGKLIKDSGVKISDLTTEIDGGFANSVYLVTQLINGGNA